LEDIREIGIVATSCIEKFREFRLTDVGEILSNKKEKNTRMLYLKNGYIFIFKNNSVKINQF